MAISNGEQASDELLQAQALIWNHIFSFINSFSLKCAVQLEIPDFIHKHGKPMNLSDLVDALPINKAKAGGVLRLMRLLIHAGFFLESGEGYLLTPAARLLLKDNPLGLAPFLLMELDPVFTEPWHGLSDWFKDDLSGVFETFHGRNLWEIAGEEPRINHLFNEAMASDSRFVAGLVIKDCRHVFEGIESMVDVAGGTGTMARAISKEFPHMSCLVLDLPHVVDGLEESRNLVFVGGDMFDSIPPTHAVLLKWILHDWHDEACVKLLKKCKEAILYKGQKGKVVIIDMVLTDDKGREDSSYVETQLFFDMLMMVDTSGKERTEKDWAKLFFDAGFSNYKITPKLGVRSLIEVYP